MIAASAVFALAERWAAGARETAAERLAGELRVRVRADALAAARKLETWISATRAGDFAAIPVKTERLSVNLTIGGARVPDDPAFADAQELEFKEKNAKSALEKYKQIAVGSADAPSRIEAARAARRLAAGTAERSACEELLIKAVQSSGVQDLHVLLAQADLAMDGGPELKLQLARAIEVGDFAAAPPADRILIYKKLGGDAANINNLICAAAVFDLPAGEDAALAGDVASRRFLTWRLPSPAGRLDLAAVDAAALGAAGESAGDWSLVSASGAGDGEAFPPPFASLKYQLHPAAAGRASAAASGEYFARLAAGAAVAAAILAGAALFVIYARRRERLARQTENFLAATTHELKTPLANIRMFAETIASLESGAPSPGDPGRVASFAKIIMNESDRLHDRIQEILDVAAGQSAAARREAPFDPGPALRAAVELYQSSSHASGGTLILQCDGAPRNLTGSEALFRRCVAAAIENALKFGRGKPVLVTASASNGKFTVRVEDGGPGIPTADRERVFEPFVRLEDEMTRSTPGTGLGLTLARQCAAACNGIITIEESRFGGAALVLDFVAANAAP